MANMYRGSDSCVSEEECQDRILVVHDAVKMEDSKRYRKDSLLRQEAIEDEIFGNQMSGSTQNKSSPTCIIQTPVIESPCTSVSYSNKHHCNHDVVMMNKSVSGALVSKLTNIRYV